MDCFDVWECCEYYFYFSWFEYVVIVFYIIVVYFDIGLGEELKYLG